MTRWRYVVRFFTVVPPLPPLMVPAFVAVTIAAAGVIVFDPARAAGALTPVLLLQLFACSSGFDVPARRGHYDLLFTHGETRGRIVIGHWVASALPGVVCWVVLGATARAIAPDDVHAALFSSGTVAAMGLVSSIAWATTLRLPRFSGAIGWLLVVATVALIAPDFLASNVDASIQSTEVWLQTAGAVLIYPPLLVGEELRAAHGAVVLPAVTCACAASAAACWSAIRRDIPLEAAQ